MEMNAHESLIQTFYAAFARADAEGMVGCYHDQVRFNDPAFGELSGEDAKSMWRMLVRPGILITVSDISANDKAGSAAWVAEYKFGKAQRQVVNRIHAEFEFKDGSIIRHTDHFDLWKWSRQALGLPGLFLGSTAWMQRKIRKQTRLKLEAFKASRSGKN